jgi:hypothetical protein
LLAVGLNRGYPQCPLGLAEAPEGCPYVRVVFVSVIGSLQSEAEQGAKVAAGQVNPATLATSFGAERDTLWMLLTMATASVVLGTWRPHLTHIPD